MTIGEVIELVMNILAFLKDALAKLNEKKEA